MNDIKKTKIECKIIWFNISTAIRVFLKRKWMVSFRIFNVLSLFVYCIVLLEFISIYENIIFFTHRIYRRDTPIFFNCYILLRDKKIIFDYPVEC